MKFRKVWIEAALNGPWGRVRQPLMPIAVREIIAEGIDAANAGAAIVHFHAYNEETSHQKETGRPARGSSTASVRAWTRSSTRPCRLADPV
jgi:uncharacterized protein (DUF849 family)